MSKIEPQTGGGTTRTPANSPLLKLPNTYRTFYGAFSGLHPLQQQAIDPILADCDLIIQSATGSGKTEAVLAPCLEQVIRSPESRAVLYIVPTRALAFDIRRRFATLLRERLQLHFAIRTGDMKHHAGNAPDIMLTTPESLDVLLGSANRDLHDFTHQIRTVIIDEVHPFIEQYRGRQLAFLLHRLERRTGKKLQKIALSATIADPSLIARSLNFKADFIHLKDSLKRAIKPRLIHLKNDEEELVTLLDDLYREWHYNKILIFANSRSRCDKIFAQLNQEGSFQDNAELHYSNLNTEERQKVEKRFRQRQRSVCIATSTLELGIDIGDVDAVLLFEPPVSVSAFLQRIGRANRRQQTINFWGICHGETASLQVLRFLALLHLAAGGEVEIPLPKTLPSVLSQQIISCLYEKKELSLKSLQNLFPAPDSIVAANNQSTHSVTGIPAELLNNPVTQNKKFAEAQYLEQIFKTLTTKKWLRKTAIAGLFRGGWSYWNCLKKYQIWSNFPENETDYKLDIAGEVIADIPQSTVKQFDPGDHVLLAGRRLQITLIDDDNHKVSAVSSRHQETKELSWLGPGSHVSYEVAQAMRTILKSSQPEDNKAAPGLFQRTQRLIQDEIKTDQSAVTLENGIEVTRTVAGTYHYRTFIGSIGNLILAWSSKKIYHDKLENFSVISDEIGLYCSHLIDFQKLSLPLSATDFDLWIKPHYKALKAIFSLNAFTKTLPLELVQQELADLIRDQRLLNFFKSCHKLSSRIVSGDPQNLDLKIILEKAYKPVKFAVTSAPLLQEEKQRLQDRLAHFPEIALNLNASYQSRNLTGSLFGDYFRLRQCQRFFAFYLLPFAHRKAMENFPEPGWPTNHKLTVKRQSGHEFETKIFTYLKQNRRILNHIMLEDSNHRPRSLSERFNETISVLQSLAQTGHQPVSGYIFQPVLRVAEIILPDPTYFIHVKPETDALPGIGIPDLIQVTGVTAEKITLRLGDIKNSRHPLYQQKWQVAFYAFLLQKIVDNNPQLARLRVATDGFLLTPDPHNREPQRHQFPLSDYQASITTVFNNLQKITRQAPAAVTSQMQNHCVNCSYFGFCLAEALNCTAIHFIPQLSRNEFLQLNTLELSNLNQVVASEDCSASLKKRAAILLKPEIVITESICNQFPKNISTSFFIYLIDNGSANFTYQGIGFAWKEKNRALQVRSWVNFNAKLKDAVLQDFCKQWSSCWRQDLRTAKSSEPHLFLFDNHTRQYLREDLATLATKNPDCLLLKTVLQSAITPDHTILYSLFQHHFNLPIPGRITRFSLNHILKLIEPNELPRPETLWHNDPAPTLTQEPNPEDTNTNSNILKKNIETNLQLLLKLDTWARRQLQSQWRKQKCATIPQPTINRMATYQEFLKAESTQKKNEILALQRLSLNERRVRFRALGPLNFSGTTLDKQGHFLYQFKLTNATPGLNSKFRSGDFLKLAAIDCNDIQNGWPVVLTEHDNANGQVTLSGRNGRNLKLFGSTATTPPQLFSLEEDTDDLNLEKLLHVVKETFSNRPSSPILSLLSGALTSRQAPEQLAWINSWLNSDESKKARLNQTQIEALKLPFTHSVSLINGPPGTGKTNLAGWIIIALIRRAQSRGLKLRLAVTALTHQAIDQLLNRVVDLINKHGLEDLPIRCLKLGRMKKEKSSANNINTGKQTQVTVEAVENRGDARRELNAPYLILGATGFGLNQLLKKQHPNAAIRFDWIIFDEASQILLPQALLSLEHGLGNFLFLGDVQQLPPIIHTPVFRNEEGNTSNDEQNIVAAETRSSLLQLLLQRYPQNRCQLDTTYRMNAAICKFPSRMWYADKLHPSPEIASTRLILPGWKTSDERLEQIINPQKPVIAVEVSHQGCSQQSASEAEFIARLTWRFIDKYKISPDQIAIISPHRAQNNAIRETLLALSGNNPNYLPLIDTVERMQGAERDIIIFGLTSSNPDQVLSEFLNNPNRFNVAITRARLKLIVVGSETFFSAVANSESELQNNTCFKKFVTFCRKDECCIAAS